MSELAFIVAEADGRESALVLAPRRTVIAGWTARDREAMEHHMAELEALGIKRPPKTPVFYRVASARLTFADTVEVTGSGSSGEVEFVLVRADGELFVGLGSDHTDRTAEAYEITASKQMCDKPLARRLWRMADVADHWDRLRLSSLVPGAQGREVTYQDGPVTTMLAPDDLIRRFEDEAGPFTDGDVMFCGTLPAVGGVRFSDRLAMTLRDPVLDRTIEHAYRVSVLPVAG